MRRWGDGFHSSGEEAVFKSVCVGADIPVPLSEGSGWEGSEARRQALV